MEQPDTTIQQPPRTDLWLENLLDERDGAALYDALADCEKDEGRAKAFRELAAAERRHADVWVKKLDRAGVQLPPDRPSKRIRALIWLAHRLGTHSVLPLVMETEQGDAAKYAAQGGDATQLAEEERAHEETLRRLNGKQPSDARQIIAGRERWHRAGRGGSIRAAIFGMNDGLVSNLSLVLGVAGAGVAPETVLLTGVAGLLAGAFSMAVGEYVSVASQRDLLTRQVALEKRELEEAPEEEAAELALIYKQKGLTTEQATQVARDIMKDPEQALDTLVREELGLDPDDLGSPIGAGVASFLMFAVGAIVPVVPFMFMQGLPAVVLASALAGSVLASVGGLVGFLSGTGVLKSAARQVLLAGLAAGATYGLGRLFDVATPG